MCMHIMYYVNVNWMECAIYLNKLENRKYIIWNILFTVYILCIMYLVLYKENGRDFHGQLYDIERL